MRQKFMQIRNLVASLAAIVIGILDVFPIWPQWAWIALWLFGLVLDGIYFVIARRRKSAAAARAVSEQEPGA
ncbi:hypothetical protein GP695_34550 [Enterobacteriaceae bacterium TzEc051]|nr:hypothetical protein GP695_34550 [Enterobacteriaceae bacterium TzEc051]